jgi:hypothetical protein
VGKIIELDCITKLDLPPERILENAKPLIGEGVVIVGWDTEGKLYFASSIADRGEVLWLLELAKKQLLEVEI